MASGREAFADSTLTIAQSGAPYPLTRAALMVRIHPYEYSPQPTFTALGKNNETSTTTPNSPSRQVVHAMMDFSGKSALVTGGTRGIGRAIVEQLERSGASVYFTGRSETSPSVDGGRFLTLDLDDERSFTKFFADLDQTAPSLDILINNAGVNVVNQIGELRDADWDRILAVNLTGAMKITRHIAGMMRNRRIAGRILNISSIYGIVSNSGRASYSASKAGMIGLTRACALDLAAHGILVNALCPGFTMTELTESILSAAEKDSLARSVPLGRFATVQEIANAALFLCSDLNTYITGQTLVIDGGYLTK